MTIVHIMHGLPGSGKSTHARSLDAMRFSLDDFREMCRNDNGEWTDDNEKVAIAAMIEGARAAIVSGHDVCLDNTHVVPRLPKMYRKEFASLGVTFKVHNFMHVSVEDCIKNDAERTYDRVGEAIIRKMADRYAGASKNGWRLTDKWMNMAEYVHPKPYHPDITLPPAVIVDIDGTVAVHGDERGHYEYEKVHLDTPNHAVLRLVEMIPPEVKVIFLSGREDRCRDATTDWLFKHGVYSGMLLMRTTGDHRPDYIIKQELFDETIRDNYHVLFSLDDRNQVVDMWREMGLTCLQVAPGDF